MGGIFEVRFLETCLADEPLGIYVLALSMRPERLPLRIGSAVECAHYR